MRASWRLPGSAPKTCRRLKIFVRLPLLAVVFALVLLAGKGMTQPPPVYCTGKTMEIDRCASAWLIKRHVAKDAKFLFQDDQELLETTAIPFDVPTATLRRSHKQSTFEVIRDSYGVDDPGVEKIAALIHDIEINFWNNKTLAETTTFARELNEILHAAHATETAVAGCFNYLDTFVDPKRPKRKI